MKVWRGNGGIAPLIFDILKFGGSVLCCRYVVVGDGLTEKVLFLSSCVNSKTVQNYM